MTEKTTWLPTILFDMTQLFGSATALRFAADFGGRRLYVPLTTSPDHQIAQSVGLEVMAWLIEAYGGEEMMVPLGEHSSYTKRVAAIRRMVNDGEATSTITKTAGCHTRTVYRHRSNAKSDQGDLF